LLLGVAAALVIAAAVLVGGHVLGRNSSRPQATGNAAAATTSSPSASPSPHSAATPARSATAPPGVAAVRLTAARSAAASVLALINRARAGAGLPAYRLLSGLDVSAGKHDQLMASGCGLSHQCPGEPSLGERETQAGVRWTAAGENIGEGGPVADTTTAITLMAVALTQDMLNEKPPNDGHRLNLLSSKFGYVGISVSWASNGTVWMTQDFAN